MSSRYYEALKRYRKNHPEKRKEANRRNLAKTANNNSNSNQLWSIADTELVMSQPKKLSDREMSELIGRPVQSIRSYRSYLKMAAKENLMKVLVCIVFLSVFTGIALSEEIPEDFVAYKVKARDTLSKIAPRGHWDIIKRVNRIDETHLIIGKNIFIPNDLEKAEKFLPVPEYLENSRKTERMIYVFLEKQYFGAYENGKLVFWGPISSGAKGKATPRGNYAVRWRAKNYHSKKYDADMNFAINISDDGYFLHEQALPGRPASHGCVRLLRSDAERIFKWVKKHDPVILANSTALRTSRCCFF